MKHYLKIYKTLLRLNFANLVTYRGNFINSFFSSLAWGVFGIISIALLTSRTSRVSGWSREELLILAGAYSVVVGLFHMLFSRNFERFSRIIHRGELDILLLKPVNAQFLSSFWLIHYPNLSRILFGIIFVFYMLQKMHVTVTLANIAGFVVLTLVSVTFLYSVWFIAITLTLWFTTLSNLPNLLYTITSISRFPQEVYSELKHFIFTFFLPFSLVVATPTKAVIHKALGGDVWQLVIFSVVLFVVSRAFWKFALRFYTSASS